MSVDNSSSSKQTVCAPNFEISSDDSNDDVSLQQRVRRRHFGRFNENDSNNYDDDGEEGNAFMTHNESHHHASGHIGDVSSCSSSCGSNNYDDDDDESSGSCNGNWNDNVNDAVYDWLEYGTADLEKRSNESRDDETASPLRPSPSPPPTPVIASRKGRNQLNQSSYYYQSSQDRDDSIVGCRYHAQDDSHRNNSPPPPCAPPAAQPSSASSPLHLQKAMYSHPHMVSFCSPLTLSSAPPFSCRKKSCPVEVKDTTKIKRKKANLPKMKPSAIRSGNWLTNRYVVNDYIVLDKLGKGSYSEVRLCKEKRSNRLYAMKIMNKSHSWRFLEDVKREIAIMKQLRHPNVLRLYEVMDDPKINRLYLVLEYMKGGDLFNGQTQTPKQDHGDDNNTVFQVQPMLDGRVWDIAFQILQGLQYLHDNNIVHGDIKPQNILVNEDGVIKIADFGISRMLEAEHEEDPTSSTATSTTQNKQQRMGTPAFLSPEQCGGGGGAGAYDGKLADLYAVGATLYCIREGRPPFLVDDNDNDCNIDNDSNNDNDSVVGRDIGIGITRTGITTTTTTATIIDDRFHALYIKIQRDDVVFRQPDVGIGLQQFLRGFMRKEPLARPSIDQALRCASSQLRLRPSANPSVAGSPPTMTASAITRARVQVQVSNDDIFDSIHRVRVTLNSMNMHEDLE